MDFESLPELQQLKELCKSLASVADTFADTAGVLEDRYKTLTGKNATRVVQETADSTTQLLFTLAGHIYGTANACVQSFERLNEHLQTVSDEMAISEEKVLHYRERVARHSVTKLVACKKHCPMDTAINGVLPIKRNDSQYSQDISRIIIPHVNAGSFRSAKFARLLRLVEVNRIAPLDLSKFDRVGHGGVISLRDSQRRRSIVSLAHSMCEEDKRSISSTSENSAGVQSGRHPPSVANLSMALRPSFDVPLSSQIGMTGSSSKTGSSSTHAAAPTMTIGAPLKIKSGIRFDVGPVSPIDHVPTVCKEREFPEPPAESLYELSSSNSRNLVAQKQGFSASHYPPPPPPCSLPPLPDESSSEHDETDSTYETPASLNPPPEPMCTQPADNVYANRADSEINVIEVINSEYAMSCAASRASYHSSAGAVPTPTLASTLPNWVPKQCVGKAIAVYDFEKRQQDELTLEEGMVIYVLDKNDSDWWLGTTAPGISGVFPAMYVNIVEHLG